MSRTVRMDGGEVHVWHADLAPLCVGRSWATPIVDDAERRRAERFRSALDGDRYLAAHAWLRMLLASYAHEPAKALRFAAGPLGKPQLDSASGERPVEFNLSRCGTVVLCAVAAGRRVGVDVEKLEPVGIDDERLSSLWLSPWERDALTAMDDEERMRGFYALWTRREAYLKARGTGLSGLSELAGAPPDQRWEIRELWIDPFHAAALAVEASPDPLSLGSWDGLDFAVA